MEEFNDLKSANKNLLPMSLGAVSGNDYGNSKVKAVTCCQANGYP